jgi:hypothetical protein
LGEAVNGRALLIIDAINEGDRREWKRVLPGLRRRLGDYPNVALVVSCRQPFDDQLFSRRVRAHFVSVYHDGFAEREFDAQLSFFDYYDIPAPHFPLITEEFSRPLIIDPLSADRVGRAERTGPHYRAGCRNIDATARASPDVHSAPLARPCYSGTLPDRT